MISILNEANRKSTKENLTKTMREDFQSKREIKLLSSQQWRKTKRSSYLVDLALSSRENALKQSQGNLTGGFKLNGNSTNSIQT